MRIAFIEPSGWNYTMDAPYEEPMGGAMSALCYLAPELVKLGHAVTVLNGVPVPAVSRGVSLQNLSAVRVAGFLNTFDVVVLLGLAQGRALRRDYGVTVPTVLWTGHAHDQPAVRDLSRQNERRHWTGFAFVSDWQRRCYEKVFGLPAEKCHVLRNAVSPMFVAQDDRTPWFVTGEAPILFYTSTPFRGLDVLLRAFPAIRAEVPSVRLCIYSSMAVYRVGPADDKFHDLYNRARSLDGVEYVGAVGQARLAKDLTNAAALAYPSTFAETSCIAVLEAMALGAGIFTTRYGALPETTAGLASMVDWQADPARLAQSFAAMAAGALLGMRRDPQTAAAQRAQRVKHIRERYLWPARAKEWEQWLAGAPCHLA